MRVRILSALVLGAIGVVTLTGCTPASIPTVEAITSADLGPVKLMKEVKGYCYPTELFCSNPLFEPGFTAPADADPVEVCEKVIDLQQRIGLVAYSAAGADAGKVKDVQQVKDFCAQGFELGGDDGAGNPFYEGTILYDDGSNDGVGKVTVISREADRGYTVVFSVSKNLGRVGWVPYGGEPVHTNN